VTAPNRQLRRASVPARPIGPASRTRISDNREISPALAINIGAWYITARLLAVLFAFGLVLDRDAELRSCNG
jgi:hypothetical protein